MTNREVINRWFPSDGLYQGDIIAREPLLDVLNHVHLHFTDPKYLAFIVLTQTCDLVMRRSVCKAKHISLAVIRPLSALLPKVLEEMCQSPALGVFAQDRREAAEQFLHRVLNQNEQAQGWVYLHPDADVGVGEPAVAMLRVSISLRAKEHYDLIREARCGRLETEYRNKLGWLKGNLYSRIDTPDWGDHAPSEESEEGSIIRDLLDAPIAGRHPLWVPTAWIAEAKRHVNLNAVPPDQIAQVLRNHAPKPPLESALAEVTRIVDLMRVEFTDRSVTVFGQRIQDDPTLMPLFSREIVNTVRGVVGAVHGEQLWQFSEALTRDSQLNGIVAASLRDAATKFIARRGPRQVNLFMDSLATLLPLSPAAVERVGQLARENLDEAYPTHAEAISTSLEAMAFPSSLVDHVQSLVLGCIQEFLADGIARRLTNSTAFKKTLRPE